MQSHDHSFFLHRTIDRTCFLALFVLVLVINPLMAIDQARAAIINFEEYPLGTQITDQYQNLGVIFSGDPYPPTINIPFWNLFPQEPALYIPNTQYNPAGIIATFVNPADGTPAEALNAVFNYYILFGAYVTFTFYDINGAIISQQTADDIVFELYFPPRIHKFAITPAGSTYAWIDDLSFQITLPPPPPRDKNRGRPDCNRSVGNPVNVANGNKYEESLDLTISTPGVPLEFRRAYNGHSSDDGPLGYGWTHNFNLSVSVVQGASPKRVDIPDSDGRVLYFSEATRTGDTIYYGGESGVKDRLKEIISTGEYFLRRKENNLTYRFDSNGKLLGISDPNGNTLTLSYTGGRLREISNNFGKAITIQYQNNRISSITDPKNQSISYDYTNGDLTTVRYPDTNSITYAYSNHLLTDKYDTNNNPFGHWGYDANARVNNYYSHKIGNDPQEEINLTYLPGKTELRRTIGTETYLTTYTTGVVNGINVVKEIQGCSTCGGTHKKYNYSPLVDLTDMISIDDGDGSMITTHYVYDNPANSWEQVGEIQEMTEALMNPPVPEQRTTTYYYDHRSDDPFILNYSTETKPSVVAGCPQSNVITINYDMRGNIASRVETGCALINGTPTQKTYTTSYEYDNGLPGGPGQLTKINGPRTDINITNFEYYPNAVGQGNNRGQLKAVVNALNQRTEFSNYDANGNVGTITDPNGVITQRTYDQRNRIKTITNLTTTAQTQYFYDARRNLDHVILPELNQVIFSYNPANKLTEITDSLGNKIIYGYDTEGNRNREERKDPQGTLKKSLDFIYDAYNHLQRIVNPDTTYTEYTYDGRGNRKTMQDPNRNIISYNHDALFRLKDMTQPMSTVTGFGYDTQDNRSSVTDPNGYVTHYHNDDFGRNNQTGSPDTGTTKYQYDEAGNLTQRFDAKGTTVNYTYDALNRLSNIQFPSDPTQNVTFTYDSTSVTYGIGRLTGRTDPSGSYTFHYDAHGNLTKEEKTINNHLYTTQFGYDKNNRLSSLTYPSGRTATYIPDGAERVFEVRTTLNGQSKTLATSISYLPFGGITGLLYGNNLTLTQGYDTQYRATSIIISSILNLAFGYDASGNAISIGDSINTALGPAPGLLETYSYQPGTDRLTHIETAPPIDFGYDLNANITSETGWTYVYDLSNQLISVLQGGNQVGAYTYNGAGQRIKKVAGGLTKIFHYDLWGHLIAETDQTGQMLAEYVYLGDQLLAMIKPGELAYYFHNDHLGTPQVLTDANGNIAWKATYDPFGKATVSVQTVENPFRFPGQYYDPETGLHYNYFRYYNPQTGRYITPDPIGLDGGTNLFAYVENNPIKKIDRLGLDWMRYPGTGGVIPHIHPSCSNPNSRRIVSPTDPGAWPGDPEHENPTTGSCVECDWTALSACLDQPLSPNAAMACGICVLSIISGGFEPVSCSICGVNAGVRTGECVSRYCKEGRKDKCGKCVTR